MGIGLPMQEYSILININEGNNKMEEQEIIEKVEISPNNFSENDSIYISQENIENLILFSKKIKQF